MKVASGATFSLATVAKLILFHLINTVCLTISRIEFAQDVIDASDERSQSIVVNPFILPSPMCGEFVIREIDSKNVAIDVNIKVMWAGAIYVQGKVPYELIDRYSVQGGKIH